jgi:hypothetical protein
MKISAGQGTAFVLSVVTSDPALLGYEVSTNCRFATAAFNRHFRCPIWVSVSPVAQGTYLAELRFSNR